MSERQLRAFETATLGPEHAREHALMRQAQREAGTGESPAVGDTIARPAVAVELPPPDPADEVGRWERKVNLPVVAIHAAVLPTGKVMLFSYPPTIPDPVQRNRADAWLWDPGTGELTQKNPPDFNGRPANIWCAGQTFTADGELVVFGGNLAYPVAGGLWKGLNKVYTFNPFTETWREQPNMRHGRWYPTGIRLANGTVPILNGYDESGRSPPSYDTDVELFTPPATIGGAGTISLIGSLGGPGGPPVGDTYPRMFLMPSGETLLGGPDPLSSYTLSNITTSGFAWKNIDDLTRWRIWGSAVLMPGGASGSTKVMALGGSAYTAAPTPGVSTATTEIYDEANPGAGWRRATPNLIWRGHANTVLLADGSMAEIGGGVGSDVNRVPVSPQHAALPEQRQLELWDPETGDWRLGPAESEARAYHSTAVLLPDATVMSAGDEYNGDGVSLDTAEIYKPPYLFRGARPTIGSAPAEIGLGRGFGVSTPDTNIARAALVAPAAVTHGVDMNQRYIGLNVERRTGCVRITAPSNANVAPPGWYMLFLINDQGVPSVAKFVRLRTSASPATCDTAAPPADATSPQLTLTSPATGATATGLEKLKATASDNVGVVGVQFQRDGVNVGAEDRTAPYTVSWNSREVGNGTHQIRAIARDAAGRTTTQSATVTVANTDQVKPAVAITAPGWAATVSSVADFTATASDASGIEQVQFKVDNQNVGPPDTVAPYGINWSTPDVTSGNHILTAEARDAAGNVAASAPVAVNVQNSPPLGDFPPPVGQQPPTGGGSQPPPTSPPTQPKPNYAPGLSYVSLSRYLIRRGTAVTIAFRLSEAAKVTIAFERKLSGHRSRGRCVAPVKKGKRKCTLYRRSRSTIKVQGKAGANSATLTARISRGFAPGSWRLAVQATDSTGKRSAVAHLGFHVPDSPVKKVRAAALNWF